MSHRMNGESSNHVAANDGDDTPENDDMELDENLATQFHEPQDQDERSHIRSGYRQLIDGMQAGREEVSAVSVDGVEQCLDDAQSLYTSVKRSREAAYDAECLKLASAVIKEKARMLQTAAVRFELGDFATKLTLFMMRNAGSNVQAAQDDNSQSDDNGDESQDENGADESQPREARAVRLRLRPAHWLAFGKNVSALFMRVPHYSYLFGAFDPGEVHVAVKQRAARQQTAAVEAVRVEQVQHAANGAAEGERLEGTSRQVEIVRRILERVCLKRPNGRGPVGFFRFVVDPSSFSKTIENIFHVSFLIKDGLARISQDNDGLPLIDCVSVSDSRAAPATQPSSSSATSTQPRRGALSNASSAESENAHGLQTNQSIFAIDMKTWQELIDAFRIEAAEISASRVAHVEAQLSRQIASKTN